MMPSTQPNQTEKARTKLWLAVRIDGYRLQFLTTEEEWEEYSANTHLDFDRETVYQAARSNNGLLCRADGVMSAGQATGLKERIKRLLAEEAAQPPVAHGEPDPEPADALPGSKADLANKRAAGRRQAPAKSPGLSQEELAAADQVPY